jgi:hypothetical protein
MESSSVALAAFPTKKSKSFSLFSPDSALKFLSLLPMQVHSCVVDEYERNELM